MSKRYKKPKKILAIPTGTIDMPTNRPIAIYYRQSTDAQIGNVSTSLQTVDMVKYLKNLGWADKHIIMIDMDAGVSGSTKIDERPGMSNLFDLISEGKIGAVACQDEDRLFRDVTQIQVNIFIEACRAANVLVITPSMVYDFANELTGTFHARQFRFKCEMAAEYLNTVIRGKLHRAKRRLMMEGRWAGWGVPSGYMVDMRKALPDGTKNESWRRYVPFKPYEKVVNEYFRLFLSFSGSIRATVRHILEHGPYYPNPTNCRPPEGFKVHYKMHRYKKGYCPGRTGLMVLLTNAAYLGHWVVNDVVVRWNNHPSIVPTDVFFQAFNYLSKNTLEGQENPHYRPIHEHTRPSKDEKRPVERPLCSGMIISQFDGKWCNVGTNWVGPLKHYSYVLWASSPKDKYVWGKAATYVDEAIVRLIKNKLAATFDPTIWEETVQEFAWDYKKECRRIESQLNTLVRVMDNLVASLETLNNPDMIYATEARYENAQAEQARLTAVLRDMENEAQRLEEIHALKESCGPVLENWPNMTRKEKRVVLHAFVERIEATPVEGHGLHLKVCWKDNWSDEITLPRQATTGTRWLPEQTKRLLELADSGATQIEIAYEFPQRRWTLIRNKYYHERGNIKALRFRPKLIKDQETYIDYLERIGEKDDSLMDMSSVTRSERERPCELRISPQDAARRHHQPSRHN